MTSLVQESILTSRREVDVVGQSFPEDRRVSRITVWSPASVVNVSRSVERWRWRDLLWAPLELAALAWSVPLVIMLIAVPVALAVTGVLWLARQIFIRF